MRRSLRMAAFTLVLPLASVALPVLPAAAAPQRWLHVAVDGDDDESVRVNLPLSAVERMAPTFSGVQIDHLRIGDDADVARVRSIWRALRDHEGDLLTVDSKDETVRITKTGTHLLVLLTERWGGEGVEIRIPVKVLDALFPDDGPPDVVAALEALADAGDGEVIRVRGEDGLVRIWVDTKPDGDDSAVPVRRGR